MTALVRSLPRIQNTIQGQIFLATCFACLTALGAQVQVPISPVPVTLQVLFVLLSGLVLGSKLGILSQLEYLAFGLAGMPVFAQGKSGLLALLDPTGGYLVGFILGAYIAGLLAESVAQPGRIRFFCCGFTRVLSLFRSFYSLQFLMKHSFHSILFYFYRVLYLLFR